MKVMKRKCASCKEIKGVSAFRSGEDTCTVCKDAKRIKEYEDNGTVYMLACTSCKIEKNIATDFYRNNGRLIKKCKSCYKAIHLKYKKQYKVSCTKSFIFDFKKVCSRCDEIKDYTAFSQSGHVCRECVKERDNKFYLCSRCGEMKGFHDFKASSENTHRDKRSSKCIKCLEEWREEKREKKEHPEKYTKRGDFRKRVVHRGVDPKYRQKRRDLFIEKFNKEAFQNG